MKRVLAFVLLCAVFVSAFTVNALADAIAWDVDPADYTVYVLTPDGGLNIRSGPGSDYERVRSNPIPDYTALYIEFTHDGWGYTCYDGTYGWVYLGQTTTDKPQPSPSPEASPAQAPEETPDAAPSDSPAPDTAQEEAAEPDADMGNETEKAEPADTPEPVQNANGQQPDTAENSGGGHSAMSGLLVILIIAVVVLILLSAFLLIMLTRRKRK